MTKIYKTFSFNTKVHQLLSDIHFKIDSIHKVKIQKFLVHSYQVVIPGFYNNKKVIIKVRDKRDLTTPSLKVSKAIGLYINQKPNCILFKSTPKLIDYGETPDLEFLIYEFVNGLVLGNNKYYRVSYVKQNDLDKILIILQLLHRSFSINSQFSKFTNVDIEAISKRSDNNMNNKFINKKIFSVLSPKYRHKIIYLNKQLQSLIPTIEKHSKYIVHRDYRPYNFIRGNSKVFVIDFDFAGRGTKVYDALSFWATLFKYPSIQTQWERLFLKTATLSQEEKQIYLSEKFFFLIAEFSYTYEYERKYKVKYPNYIKHLATYQNILRKETINFLEEYA